MTAPSKTTERGNEAGARVSAIDTQINLIENSFGGSAYVDGLLRQRLEELKAERAALVSGSPARTPAGEAEELATEIEIEITNCRSVGRPFDLKLSVASAETILAALRRAQPPQQTGGIDAEQLAAHVERSKPAIARLRATLESRQQPTGDVEGVSDFPTQATITIARAVADKLNRARGTDEINPDERNQAERLSKDADLLARAEAAEARVAEVEKKLGEMIHAYDNGGVQIASPEIGGHDDIPPHPWHEEWMHGARALSTVAGEEK